MKSTKIIRNEDIERTLIGIPKDHKHVRLYLELKDKSIMIFQEATIANILRAYTAVKTHPKITAQELKTHTLDKTSRKKGYARHQLLKTSRNQQEIEEELRKLLENSTLEA